MPLLNRHALVAHSPKQMFRLVDRIEDYPEFLPWCGGTSIQSRDDDQVTASITIAKGAIHKTFTTRNFLQTNKMIEVRLVDGPFKQLDGFWRFDAIGDGACKISLDLKYEFASKLLGLAIGPVFQQIATTMVDSFVQQANKVYGT
ncbi:MAG: type II toxin-antitoxin system RatA family toxin [Gammaproteobacteria bacterium]|nr:type II toxin-antitoxin system RatA family toxin [Gammaproteobacteria bacterium]